jgi:hypothetical protein
MAITLNKYSLLARRTDGRPCDPNTIIAQIGRMNVYAISGGTVYPIMNDNGETVGIRLPNGANRCVDVVLAWNDTYTVSRHRVIAKGTNKGDIITEEETDTVYCDEVGQIAYRVSCWQ